jgi:HAD superfamily hydrolase (TIGR01509 family)
MIKVLIFDWGDTIMRDLPEMPGPMASWERVECIPGAKDALENLTGKYICVIATNAGASDTELMRKALRRVDAERYFRYFFSSKDLGVKKPDSMFFQRIAAATGTKPAHCVNIGNLYEKDILGAKAAGMLTIFYNEKYLQGSFPDADAVINHMNELTDIISRLDKQ